MPSRVGSVVATVLFALQFSNLAQAHSGSLMARNYRESEETSEVTQVVKTLQVTNTIVAPDGHQRLAVVADGRLPGPLITAKKGEVFKVKVNNELVDHSMFKTTSIHWHGLFMNNTNWADGATFVNQCPISSGHSFTYEVPTGEHTNSYWWHGHHEAQYCDGLRGGLIIYDDEDAHRDLYDIDDENTVITLQDWFHVVANEVTPVTHPESTLINGKGRFVGGPEVALSVISVEHGKRYRMRLLNIGCDANFIFSIDGHELEVIETDGINTVPFKTDSIQIYTGQRYSFVFTANQPVDNYWVRALPHIGPVGYEGGVNSAILRYVGAPVADPVTVAPETLNPPSDYAHEPLENPAAPGIPELGAADVNIRLEIAWNDTSLHFEVNGVTYRNPAVPVLLQILSGARDARDLLPAGSVYVLPRDKVIEVTVKSLDMNAPHPFHLHGHAFSVIKGVNATEPNFTNPGRRDVYSAGGTDNETVIRFVTDNAGPWMFHCHIEFHAMRGMAIVFAADTPTAGIEDVESTEWDELCPIYNALAPEDH